MHDLSLSFVGDICPADMRLTKGVGIKSRFEKEGGVRWKKNLKEILHDSDISFCNLEAPLINSIKFDDNYHFAGTLEFADFLKDCGFDIVSIANNHILEEGESGFISTISQLEKSKIKYIGKQNNGSSNIEIITLNGKKIGFVAFNAVDLDKIDDPNLIAEFSEKNIFSAVEKLNVLEVDFKIFSFHWGNEYVNIPSEYQIKFAHKLIDSGVNLIVGHHSHVIQPVEEYKNGLIIYSLGNCLFDSIASKNTAHGLCVKVQINSENRISYNLVSLKLNDKGVSVDNSERAIKKLSVISNNYKTFLKRPNYQQSYIKIKNSKRFSARIFMKYFFLKQFFSESSKNKRFLLKNVLEYYTNR
ncbi:MAG: CapA family protein [Melioribacteraceae bacterium]|nr:CapA family protein [Melioribacteraceae bacterium]